MMPRVRRIVVIRPGALGDTILTLPALAALRHTFPDARCTFIGNPAVLPLLSLPSQLNGRSPADATSSFDDPALGVLFDEERDDQRLARDDRLRMSFEDADLAVVWLSNSVAVANNLRRLGVRQIIAAPSRPPEGLRQHVSEYLLGCLSPVLGEPGSRLLECVGASGARLSIGNRDEHGSPAAGNDPPLLVPAPEDRSRAESFLAAHNLGGCQVIALHPGSGGRAKCWPAERFAALADRLARQGTAILHVSGPADDWTIPAFERALSAAQPVAAHNLDLPLLAAVLARCAAFAGNDSGISHLAAALGTPTVAIYGPTDPTVWGVRGNKVIRLARDIRDVSVDAVERAFFRLLRTMRVVE